MIKIRYSDVYPLKRREHNISPLIYNGEFINLTNPDTDFH